METDYTHPQQTGKTDKPDYKVKTDTERLVLILIFNQPQQVTSFCIPSCYIDTFSCPF